MHCSYMDFKCADVYLSVIPSVNHEEYYFQVEVLQISDYALEGIGSIDLQAVYPSA